MCDKMMKNCEIAGCGWEEISLEKRPADETIWGW